MPWIYDHDGTRLLLGIHRAIVVDRNDSADKSSNPARGRIRVRIPYLTNDEDHTWLCDTCFPSNQFFSVPAVGDMVMVAFNAGHPEQPVWLGSVNTKNGVKDPPSRFSLEEPDNSGYESLGGHFLEFHDKAGVKHIRLEDSKGNYQLFDTEQEDWEIHFHHDERRTIDHDVTDQIGNDETRNIGNDRTQTVGNDEDLTVGNDQTQNIGNDQTEEIGNDRDITIDNDDHLTITKDRTTDVTGDWTETVQGTYSLDGQSTADWTFQDTITFTTEADFKQTVTGDWTADVTGDTKFTITGDWKGTVTGDWKNDVTGDIELKTSQKFTAKNTLFEFNMDTSTSQWKCGATSIAMTAASIVMTVGGTTWTISAGGVIFIGAQYKMNGIDVITHKHLTIGSPPYTSTWVAGP